MTSLGERIPPRDLSRQTGAESFDAFKGALLVDESKVRGTAVGGGAGDRVQFADADLGADAKSFSARVSRAAAGSASVEVRLDDPVNGPLVGTAEVASTGDRSAYATTTATLSRAHGRHDVYLVFTGDLRVSTFSIT
jgi:beta-glucosidase